jgi:hemerythrin-like domain-containing protein
MARTIDILREEHRNIETLLLVLEQELTVFDRRQRPDYDIIRAAIEYLRDYPDRLHHPREDLIFAKIRERDPLAAAVIGDLDAEHRVGSKRLQRVADTIASILTEHDLLRETVHQAMHDFIDREREHIRMEERVLFPTALLVLQPQDWAEIEARLSDARDPLFAARAEAKFDALQRRILQWEQENEAERKQASA